MLGYKFKLWGMILDNERIVLVNLDKIQSSILVFSLHKPHLIIFHFNNCIGLSTSDLSYLIHILWYKHDNVKF